MRIGSGVRSLRKRRHFKLKSWACQRVYLFLPKASLHRRSWGRSEALFSPVVLSTTFPISRSNGHQTWKLFANKSNGKKKSRSKSSSPHCSKKSMTDELGNSRTFRWNDYVVQQSILGPSNPKIHDLWLSTNILFVLQFLQCVWRLEFQFDF